MSCYCKRLQEHNHLLFYDVLGFMNIIIAGGKVRSLVKPKVVHNYRLFVNKKSYASFLTNFVESIINAILNCGESIRVESKWKVALVMMFSFWSIWGCRCNNLFHNRCWTEGNYWPPIIAIKFGFSSTTTNTVANNCLKLWEFLITGMLLILHTNEVF